MVDLHIHTDGGMNAFPVEMGMIEFLMDHDINIFSFTDFESVMETSLQEVAIPDDVLFIRGVEFRCKTRLGACNILGFGYDMEKRALGRFVRYRETMPVFEAKAVIGMLEEVGGIAVWAHPLADCEGEDGLLPSFYEQLEELTGYGLQGLECYYSIYSEKQVEALLKVAQERHLYISGGSGYGTEGMDVPLGKLNNYGKVVTEEELTIVAELKRRLKENPRPLFQVLEWAGAGGRFWIQPKKIVNMQDNPLGFDNQLKMDEEIISVWEDEFEDFLFPVFEKHFSPGSKINDARWDPFESFDKDKRFVKSFEWYVLDNFFTLSEIEAIAKELEESAAILEIDYYDERLDFLRRGYRNIPSYFYEYWNCRNKVPTNKADEIAREHRGQVADYYRRLVKALNAMTVAARGAGYEVVSVHGP